MAASPVAFVMDFLEERNALYAYFALASLLPPAQTMTPQRPKTFKYVRALY